jgi:hypothetical protein
VQRAIAEGRTVIACGISCRHQLHDALGIKAKHWVQVMQAGPESPAADRTSSGGAEGA